MPVCSVKICKNRSGSVNYKQSGVTYHRFPNEADVKEKWINATGRPDNWFPTKYCTICSSHFEEKCFKLKKRRKLFPWAAPTLNLRFVFAPYISEPSASTDLTTVSSTSEHRSPASSGARKRSKPRVRSAETGTESSDASRTEDELRDNDDSCESSHQTCLATKIDKQNSQLQEDRCCNVCNNVISGFRYICVQCTGVDLCGACETASLHGQHYVLRIPQRRPSEEITSVLEKIREELLKHENTVESIEIEIKEEPDPLGVVYIDTSVSRDHQPMIVESQMTRIQSAMEESCHQTISHIPNKRRRIEIEEFLNFKHQNVPSHSTTHLHSTVASIKNIVDIVPDIKDIKVEIDDSEEPNCQVLMHKEADLSFRELVTTPTNVSKAGTYQRSTIVSQRRLAVNNFVAAPTTSDKMVTESRPQQTSKREATKDVTLSRPTVSPGRCFVEVTGTDAARSEDNLPEDH